MQSAQTNAPNSEFMHVLLHNLAMSRKKNLNNKTAQILTVFQNRVNAMKFKSTLVASYQFHYAIKNTTTFLQIIINHVTFSVGQETAF